MMVPCSGRKSRSDKKLRSNSCSSPWITKKFNHISKSKDPRHACSRQESISRGKTTQTTMVVPCSGRKPRTDRKLRSNSCSSSWITKKFDHISKSKDPRHACSREESISSHTQAFGIYDIPWTHVAPEDDPNLKLAIQALNFYNQNSPQKFQLLKLGCVTPVALKRCMLLHINFRARNTLVAAAPDEMFFTEMTNSFTSGVSIRLCVSLGPVNSLSASGDKLNGCCYCRCYNNVWHPKGGGFVRGDDEMYKTVQDICDTNQNNAIPEYEMHLARLKQVSLEPQKDRHYISERVDGASLYASEALKYYNQEWKKYELVEPGFVTCVILPTCLLFHVNFKAKETDVVTAPEEMFFAELTGTSGVLSCKCCMILKPVDLITGDETGDRTNGCYYCHEFNNVRHPTCPKFVRGGDSMYKLEKELE